MMRTTDSAIDGGTPFDWDKASGDYAAYRDIYPAEFYQWLLSHGLCTSGQNVLDIGTGTGVLPRNLYQYGARFTGVDPSPGQIGQAERLARQADMDIKFLCLPAEETAFGEASFDVVTACQCLPYFSHSVLAPKLHSILKPDGRLVFLYMAWLPLEDEIAGQSEELVLSFNPKWTGCGETRHMIEIPSEYKAYFETETRDLFDVRVPFRRETWNGRMRSCRGIGASLSPEETARFDREHASLLSRIAPEQFEILHYVAAAVLRKKPEAAAP